MVTVPSPLCRPAMLRQPPVAGLSEAWIPRDAVRHADIQSILQDVLQHPGAVDQAPFLQAGSGLGLGVRHVSVDRGRHQRPVALVANVKSVGVGEPDAEGKRSACARGGVGKSRQDRDRHRCKVSSGTGWQCPRRAHLIHGVDAIAAAAFADVQRVVEDGDAAEIGVLAGLVGAELEDARSSRCSAGSVESGRGKAVQSPSHWTRSIPS